MCGDEAFKLGILHLCQRLAHRLSRLPAEGDEVTAIE
jgi:hypothetical protein